MLMKQLIGDLLLRHNCVVVPAFGGFVAKQTSAVIDTRNGVMLPPRKSLLFNKQLINNDGLLISAYAQASGLDYKTAAAEIDVQVKEWQKILHTGERITLERVGYLFLDGEKNIGFEQDRFFNLLLESYGLGKVQFISESSIRTIAPANTTFKAAEIPVAIQPEKEKTSTPIIEMIPVGEHIPEPAATPIIPLPSHKSSATKLWKYVAAAALLPIAFYSYWIPMKTQVLESGILAVQDFNPFYHEKTGVYESREWHLQHTHIQQKQSIDEFIASLPENISVIPYAFDAYLNMPMRIKDKSAASAKIEKAVVTQTPAPTNTAVATSGDFHFIVGCFELESNAAGLVRDLKAKGFDAYIVDVVQGKHRVSAARAENAADLKAVQLEGWILKK
jgi:hypothetical protein